MGTPHRLVQGRDLVIEAVTTLVKAPRIQGQCLLQEGWRDLHHAGGPCGGGGLLQQVQHPSGVAVGIAHQRVDGRRLELQPRQRTCPRSLDQRLQLLVVQRLQHIDLRARQQRGIHLEGRILGRCPDQRDQSRFRIGQQGVLLRLVETVDLVDEQDGVASRLQVALSLLHRRTDILHPRKDGRQRNEFMPEGVRRQPCQRGLAHTRRPPEDHRMRLPRLECQPQRPLRSQQVLLPDHLVQRRRPQQLCQRHATAVSDCGASCLRGGLSLSLSLSLVLCLCL